MLLRNLRHFMHFAKQGTVRVPYRILYDVISQTDKYDTFVPFVARSSIVEKISETQNRTQLEIFFKSFQQKFVSLVQISNTDSYCLIHSTCNNSPLQHLDSKWKIYKQKTSVNPNQDYKTFMTYDLDFEFDNWLFRLTSNQFSKIMGQEMWDIFTKKATQIYKDELTYGNLDTYLNNNPQIKDLYEKSSNWKQKIDSTWKQCSRKIDQSTQQKMAIQINSLRIKNN